MLLFALSLILSCETDASSIKSRQDTTAITRKIDVSEDFRPFPDLAALYHSPGEAF